MDRNRRIILTILLLVLMACILVVIDIGLNIKSVEKKEMRLPIPEFGPGVGVVRVYGSISISDSTGGYMGLLSGADAVVKKLSKLEKNPKIKAIVLRINSPGGTVGAVQEIFQKLMELRKKNIVLVASMGDVAASGGYYIASACNHIVANHGTITGSIGVIAASPNIKGLFEKLGIKMNVIKSGKYKDILASHRDMSDEERDMLQEMIDSSYLQFLKDVSLGRNIPISDIRPYADGRVVNGESALKYRLIDSIGTYEDAVLKAKTLAKLPEDAAVYESDSPFEQILRTIDKALLNNNPLSTGLNKNKYSLIEYSIEP
ncbi:MAG: signal peptide peptidase SppA [Spirochaetes bacterium]|nr:signal peptide peptidase SppA [Spirochaetota bacterium]